jgi:hypothetical protein
VIFFFLLLIILLPFSSNLSISIFSIIIVTTTIVTSRTATIIVFSTFLHLLTGLQDIRTFVGKDKNGVINLAWFELSDFSDRGDVYSCISASTFSNQSGTRFEPRGASRASTVGWYDAGDYLRYSNINFRSAGTTKNIKLTYAKANNGGKVKIQILGQSLLDSLLQIQMDAEIG